MIASLIAVSTCSLYMITTRLDQQHCVGIECPQNVEWIDAIEVSSDLILLVGITPPETSTDGVTGRQVAVYSVVDGQAATLRSKSACLPWIDGGKIRAIRSSPTGDLWILSRGASGNSELVGYCNSESTEIKFNELPHPPTGFKRVYGVISAISGQGFRAAFVLRPQSDEDQPIPISVLMLPTFDMEEITSQDGIATVVNVHRGVSGSLTSSNDGIFVSQISDRVVTLSSCVGEIRALVRFKSTVSDITSILVREGKVAAIIGPDLSDVRKRVIEAVPIETQAPIQTGRVLASLKGTISPRRCFLDTNGRMLVGIVSDAKIQVYELSLKPGVSARLLSLSDRTPGENFVSDVLLFKVGGVPKMIWTETSHLADSDEFSP